MPMVVGWRERIHQQWRCTDIKSVTLRCERKGLDSIGTLLKSWVLGNPDKFPVPAICPA